MEKEEFISWANDVRERLSAFARSRTTDTEAAADAVQEAMLRLWAVHRRLTTESATPIALRTVANLCIDEYRRNQRMLMLRPSAADTATQAPAADEPLTSRERLADLDTALLRLPARYRSLLQMRANNQLSYAEMAILAGSTEGSVRGMVSKARRLLMEQLRNLEL